MSTTHFKSESEITRLKSSTRRSVDERVKSNTYIIREQEECVVFYNVNAINHDERNNFDEKIDAALPHEKHVELKAALTEGL